MMLPTGRYLSSPQTAPWPPLADRPPDAHSALRRLRQGMAQQPSDDDEAFPGRDEMRGVAVPQIVKARVVKRRPGPDAGLLSSMTFRL